MNTWECEECGATAETDQRKTCIRNACDQNCRWIFNPQSHEDDQEDETEETSPNSYFGENSTR